MIYENIAVYWGQVGIEVTPQWYGERAAILGLPFPVVVTTRFGLVIDGEVVAVEVTEQPIT